METNEFKINQRIIKMVIEMINKSEIQNRIRKMKRTKSHPTNNTIKI